MILGDDVMTMMKVILVVVAAAAVVLFFTGATILYGYWPPPQFRNSKFFLGGVVSPTPNPWSEESRTTLRLAYPLAYLAWMVLLGACAPASISLRVTGARKRSPHDRALVLEEW
jgi:hypothetical protein